MTKRRVAETGEGDRVVFTGFGSRGTLEISNSEMLRLEGPESYQPGYATSARLLCWGSQVGHEPRCGRGERQMTWRVEIGVGARLSLGEVANDLVVWR